MRLCVIYDCLYPWSIGGAEGWYRLLAERMAQNGHEVTYLTRQQWPSGVAPGIPGVQVIPVSGPDILHAGDRRAIRPPLAFGWGVDRHLRRHGAGYDAVACASFPYFPLLAAARLKERCGYRLVVDWWEVWSDRYWRDYLGAIGGSLGAMVQRACARTGHIARCASSLHAARLIAIGHPGPILPIGGVHRAPGEPLPPQPAGDYILVTGRLNPDKGSDAIVPALMEARRALPGLRAIIAGDGPARSALEAHAMTCGLSGAIDFRGFVNETELGRLIARAICLLNPSRREGYGLSILDAAALGVPSVVAAGPDNAATELVVPGQTGEISPSAHAADLAAAIVRVHAAGPTLRRSTAAWWSSNQARLDAEDGLRRAEEVLFGPLAPDQRPAGPPSRRRGVK